MALSDYLETKILQHVFMNTPYTAPTTIYLALFTVSPTDAGGGTEVSGGSYARQPVTWALGAAGAGQITNAALITFSSVPACTVVAAATFDAVVDGNLLAYGDLPAPVTYTAGDNATAAIGALQTLLG